MKPGIRGLAILVLAVTAASASLFCSVMCPKGIGSLGQSGMPCSGPGAPPGPCPFSIRQANSLCLLSHPKTVTLVLHTLSAEVIDRALLWSPPTRAKLIGWDDKAPPGSTTPLFLRTHSLVI